MPRGRAVGIIGTNGSGKSTLLRLVGGIGTVDSGRVRVTGRIGALLDLGSGLHGDLTGRENVVVAGVLNGLSRREVLRRFDDIVAFSEIGQFIDNPMRTYSSGMQMRLAFAINVHTNPDVLLIDEVLAVGDAAFQRQVPGAHQAVQGQRLLDPARVARPGRRAAAVRRSDVDAPRDADGSGPLPRRGPAV